MSNINKIDTTIDYPEFGYKVKYYSEDSLVVDWTVMDENDDLLMTGVFDSKDYYKSVFNIVVSKLEENVYENLFYLYFENIKLKCIDIVEFRDPAEDLLDQL